MRSEILTLILASCVDGEFDTKVNQESEAPIEKKCRDHYRPEDKERVFWTNRCREDGIYRLESWGHTIQEGMALARTKNIDGKLIFADCYGHHLGDEVHDFYEAGGTNEFLSSLVKIEKAEGGAFFVPLCHLGFLGEYQAAGGTIEEMKAYATLTDTKGNSIFSGHKAVRFELVGGSLEKAQELSNLRNSEGDPAFQMDLLFPVHYSGTRIGSEIFEYQKKGGTVDCAKEAVTGDRIYLSQVNNACIKK